MKQYQDVTMTGQVDQYLFGIGQHFEFMNGLEHI